MKKITVITPTWNQAEFISDTIKSVINQSYENIEYIIIDNMSDDGTEDIVKRYANNDSRIMYIREPDHGQAEAINKGLNKATGDIVCWLNSDDYFYNNHVLENVVKCFDADLSLDVLVGDAWYCDKNKELTAYNSSNRTKKRWVISRWYYIVQPSVFWKNSNLRLDEKFHYVFDWKFFIKKFHNEKVRFVNRPLSVYRMYEDNKTGQDNAKRKKEIYELQKELGISKLNIAWCEFVYKTYEKAEKNNTPLLKKIIDCVSRILFHLTGKRICSF